jgi:uncharacterized protein
VIEPSLIVMAKEPVAGRVKTRLTPPCSPGEAAAIAEAALTDTLAAVAAAGSARRVLALDGKPADWIPEGFEVIQQRGDGLDERLAAAFEAVGGPSVAIGMDTPQVTPALLDDAARALTRPAIDAVLGESEDGGYWAIGLRRPRRDAFEGVPMSKPWTARAQRAQLRALGIECAILPVVRDVDTFADAVAVGAAHPGLRLAAVLESLSVPVAEWSAAQA